MCFVKEVLLLSFNADSRTVPCIFNVLFLRSIDIMYRVTLSISF